MQPPQSSALAPGFKLDRYELICPIAEGGMASVWIARQTGKHGFQKLVAVKTILPKYAADSRFQTMFLDEVRIASRIEHDNVAQILDVGEQHQTTYLVMEYVDGESLSAIHRAVKKKAARVPPGVLLRIISDVCGGLHAAHELEEDSHLLGVVHRDVSPQNVLVTVNGDAKLIDFGIAKARDRLATDTNTGTLKGKVRYMAPEQAVGRPIDRRADIWALGAILYDFLSGRPPYDGENDVQTILALTSGRPPLPVPPIVHPAICAVVMRALAATPDHRFATAAEMQRAIEDAMIEAKVTTSTQVVASFLLEHMGDRVQKRKQSIALGLKAATDREKYENLLRSNLKTTGNHAGGASESGLAGENEAEVTSAPSAVSEVTNGTLDSAAVAVGLQRMTRNRKAVLAAVISGVILGIVGMMAVVLASPSRAPSGEGRASAAGSTAPAAIPSEVRLPVEPPRKVDVTLPTASTASVPSMSSVFPRTRAATPPPPTAAPARASTRSPAPKPAHTAKPRIDDGF